MADCGEDILKAMQFWAVVVDVYRGDDRELLLVGESGQAPYSILVSTNLVVLKLNEDVPGTKCTEKAPCKILSSSRAVFESVEKGASSASGEKDEPLGSCEERVERKGRSTSGAGPVSFREEA